MRQQATRIRSTKDNTSVVYIPENCYIQMINYRMERGEIQKNTTRLCSFILSVHSLWP